MELPSAAVYLGAILGYLGGGARLFDWLLAARREKREASKESRDAVQIIWQAYRERIELAEDRGDKEQADVVRREFEEQLRRWQKEKKWELKEFADFDPQGEQRQVEDQPVPQGSMDATRIDLYRNNEGFFLVHSWRASASDGQVADLTISLHHHPDRKIPRGRVTQVVYELGRKFSDDPFVQANEEENFRLEVSAYDSMLCLARVEFSDGTPALELQRYINFPREDLIEEIEWATRNRG